MTTDTNFMLRCFELAEQGRYTCRPNPAVGCLIVKNNKVLGEGWHQVAGQAHAEVNALQQAGGEAAGACVYVSLEPCSHHGLTGPCADALIKAGVNTVVFGMQDANPNVAGKGLERLRNAGIEVRGPVLEENAKAINPGFNKRMNSGMPFVRCKVAMSLDGRTAMANGESQWITGLEAREDVHKLRAASCAIVTGIGTVQSDNPQMTVRLPGFEGKQPLRVVVDSNHRINPDAKIFKASGSVLIASAQSIESSYSSPLHMVKAFPNATGRVDLPALLRHLASDYQCNEVLIEAGAELSGAMLSAGLVDELILYMAPSLLGHEARAMATLPNLHQLNNRVQLRFCGVEMLGKDCKIRAIPELQTS